MLNQSTFARCLFSFVLLTSATPSLASDAPLPELEEQSSDRALSEAYAKRTRTKRQVGTALAIGGGSLATIGYGLSVGVSLASDKRCKTYECSERYLSFIPVAGGAVQFAVAGKNFHDDHHTVKCYPRTIAAVTGQAVGVAALTTGLLLRRVRHNEEPETFTERLALAPETYGGTGFGLTLSTR